MLNIKNTRDSPQILFHVMPEKTLNYNIIGVQDIRRHFLPVLMSKDATPNTQNVRRPGKMAQQVLNHEISGNSIKSTPIPNEKFSSPQKPSENNSQTLTYEEASKLYSQIPMPEAQPQKNPKQIIDPQWFQKLWQQFPRLAMEHENLGEPSRLPHEFFIKLKPNAKPHISPTYQMDKKRTTEMLLFLQKAIANKLIIATPCQYISASFMIPKSDPTKPYRCKYKPFFKP